ncbi:AMP-binding protein [Paenibacillus sp. SI8]|uniref:AMP-binding protein n=1 Tax=unclassified Paenibacillus TaxID=185978 RepID=UPI0034673856
MNKQRFCKEDFSSRISYLGRLAELSRPEGRVYAVCLKESFDLIVFVQYLQERSGSILLIHPDTPLETAKELAIRSNCHYLIYGNVEFIIEIDKNQPFHPPSLMQFSSGTTGKSKLVSREWHEIGIEIENYNRALSASSDEKAVILVPVSHSFGLIAGVLASMQRDAEPIVVQSPNPKFALQLIRSTPKSIIYAVPFLYHLLNSFGKEELAYHKLISSGAPLTDALLSQLKPKSHEVWQQYGCTEVGCISLGKLDSVSSDVGRPLNHLQVTLSPSASHPTLNEIVVQVGSNRIHTNDAGEIAESGELHVWGRMDDVINVSGLKVFPSELENTIGRMQGIKEVVVHKMPHKVWGEAVKAQVIVSDGIGPLEIKNWCMAHLPAYKVPSIIEIVREIPKLPSGKVSRTLLFEQERTS